MVRLYRRTAAGVTPGAGPWLPSKRASLVLLLVLAALVGFGETLHGTAPSGGSPYPVERRIQEDPDLSEVGFAGRTASANR